ncbi:hypothetical protein [Aestuariivirga sp.]|uniref:hypothetical protein n=1 Tax=Aestuariivirga sp. TaxID=2650926 RepID=UPI0039E3641B
MKSRIPLEKLLELTSQETRPKHIVSYKNRPDLLSNDAYLTELHNRFNNLSQTAQVNCRWRAAAVLMANQFYDKRPALGRRAADHEVGRIIGASASSINRWRRQITSANIMGDIPWHLFLMNSDRELNKDFESTHSFFEQNSLK